MKCGQAPFPSGPSTFATMKPLMSVEKRVKYWLPANPAMSRSNTRNPVGEESGVLESVMRECCRRRSGSARGVLRAGVSRNLLERDFLEGYAELVGIALVRA